VGVAQCLATAGPLRHRQLPIAGALEHCCAGILRCCFLARYDSRRQGGWVCDKRRWTCRRCRRDRAARAVGDGGGPKQALLRKWWWWWWSSSSSPWPQWFNRFSWKKRG